MVTFSTWRAVSSIRTSNALLERFIAAVPREYGIVAKVAPVPGKPLRFSGRVAAKHEAGGESVLEVAVRAANELGDHVTGTVTLTLPLASAARG